MAEAKPSRKRGGHAYGRRNLQLSNTAEEGELCLYTGHSMGRFSSHSMRYDSHQACTRCVAAAREGRMSFDIDRLMKKNRVKALKFWSQVDIAGPDECWNWQVALINAQNNHNLHGDVMASQLPHSIILNVLLCGSLGVILGLPVLRLLVVTSIVVILSILYHRILESL